MVSEGVLRKLLERLEIATRRLESKRGITLDEFLENWEVHSAILRELQVAIEMCIDIGNHIIAEMGWESPEVYRDVAKVLAKHRVISQEFSKIFEKMIAFRNILVHEYVELDLKKVYEYLNKLEDFRKFASFIEEFLEGKMGQGQAPKFDS